ncbi:metallophosphoesterase family protein [Brucella sp. NBRC 12950]|uniref:metallophosphoesterase family protein n=1 Tax=Brucella sp. NBRC 12950 TaxID=2994518 RepID=UPI0024A39750|nr:metallophosphoesterase family protein [Brucella sp. NBRC 12950]GLU29488.1 hydrolase [Brucella sp. NBRC 12950]
MRNIWFMSDTHFGHANIIKYSRTQFDSVDEMESTIIESWNEKVSSQDLVYHLGDFAWSAKDAKRVRPKLNGSIRLIVGNHDDIPALASAGLFQRIQMWRQFSEIGVTASHVPMRREQIRHGSMNVHGHVHGNTNGLESFHFDVSAESLNYSPIHFDVIAEWANSNRISA